jgi:uncharacterized protein (DUF983 family)
MTKEVARARILWRGATKRCARCGRGKLFRRWFTMVADCPRCGLHYEREEGYWVGAVAINTVFTFGLFFVVLIIATIATAPDIPWLPIVLVVVPLMIVVPLVFYPFSKTLWVAVDMAFLQRLSFQ